MKEAPNPGNGYRLLKVGQNLWGSYLHFYPGAWDNTPQKSDCLYTQAHIDCGLFYRISEARSDVFDAEPFNNWAKANGINDGAERSAALAAWIAAKDFYSNK